MLIVLTTLHTIITVSSTNLHIIYIYMKRFLIAIRNGSPQLNILKFKRLPPEQQSVNSRDVIEKCVFNDISVIEVDPVKSAPMDDKRKEVKDAGKGRRNFPFVFRTTIEFSFSSTAAKAIVIKALVPVPPPFSITNPSLLYIKCLSLCSWHDPLLFLGYLIKIPNKGMSLVIQNPLIFAPPQ